MEKMKVVLRLLDNRANLLNSSCISCSIFHYDFETSDWGILVDVLGFKFEHFRKGCKRVEADNAPTAHQFY
jgi:hypothetical protein